MRAIYTTPPISVGRYGQEKTSRDRWVLHSVERIRFAPSFFYGVREDNGELVQVHEHGLEFLKEHLPPATEGKEANPS